MNKTQQVQQRLIQLVAEATGEDPVLIEPHLEMCDWNTDIVIKKFEQTLVADMDKLCAKKQYEVAINKCTSFILHGKKNNNLPLQIMALHELSFMQMRHFKEYEKAIMYAEQALDIAETHNDKLGIALVRNHLGVLYYLSKQPKRAIEEYESALDLIYGLDDGHEATILSNIGNFYYQSKQFSLAKVYFEKALLLRAKKNDPEKNLSIKKLHALLQQTSY